MQMLSAALGVLVIERHDFNVVLREVRWSEAFVDLGNLSHDHTASLQKDCHWIVKSESKIRREVRTHVLAGFWLCLHAFRFLRPARLRIRFLPSSML